jgi:predicted metal-dependent phosphotriesterase family hydrolase
MTPQNAKSMGFVRTVRGDCDPATLGYCQCHDHLFIAKGKSFEVNPALYMDDEAASLAELLLYKSAGGSALVDAQPTGAGGMPAELLRISERSGVNVVASTGFHKLIFYPEGHWIFKTDAGTLEEYYIADLTEGLATDADAGIPACRISAKAGVVKCALDSFGLDEDYKRLFKAAAKAAKKTGAPMLIHTEDGAHAKELVEYIGSFGIAPERMLVCHTERSVLRFEEKLEIAKTGVYLQCDTIARFKYHSDEDEARFFLRLCEAGYEDRILMGLDTTRRRLKSYGGETGLDYILKVFLPLLRESGFKEEQIHKFCVENPASALAFSI